MSLKTVCVSISRLLVEVGASLILLVLGVCVGAVLSALLFRLLSGHEIETPGDGFGALPLLAILLPGGAALGYALAFHLFRRRRILG